MSLLYLCCFQNTLLIMPWFLSTHRSLFEESLLEELKLPAKHTLCKDPASIVFFVRGFHGLTFLMAISLQKHSNCIFLVKAAVNFCCPGVDFNVSIWLFLAFGEGGGGRDMAGIPAPQIGVFSMLAIEKRPRVASWWTMQTRSSTPKGFLLVSWRQCPFQARKNQHYPKAYFILCEYDEGIVNPFQTWNSVSGFPCYQMLLVLFLSLFLP